MKEIKQALKISGLCIFTYLTSYLFRNLLSVFTPQMLEEATLTKETAALLSSVYMIVYASGQLICGVIGDYVKPKFMVFGGLVVSGIGLLGFPLFANGAVQVLSFALLGFGLSALRGPLVKTISENMEQKYARISCVFLSFASLAGPLIAGLFALRMQWYGAFYLSAGIAFGMAVLSFLLLSLFEKKGLVHTRSAAVKTENGTEKAGILDIFRLKGFVAYLFIGMVAEISTSAISFWIPTYVTEHLHFAANISGIIFSVISFLRAFTPFLCLVALKLFRSRDMHLLTVLFGISGVFFLLMLPVQNRWFNLLLFIVPLVSTSLASSVMWSIYIPSLAKSGKVSSANGILDCSGYIGAASTNMLFAVIMERFGWSGTILSWSITSFIGILITVLEIANRRRLHQSFFIDE